MNNEEFRNAVMWWYIKTQFMGAHRTCSCSECKRLLDIVGEVVNENIHPIKTKGLGKEKNEN